jgi:hypothetical protein
MVGDESPLTVAGGLRCFGTGGQSADVEDFHFAPHDGLVFTDGSALHGSREGLASAGAAAVQVSVVGVVVKAARVPVPCWMPQTAAAGEHLAAALAAALADGPITLVTDCAGVVTSFCGGASYACGYKRPFGGLWKDMFAGATLTDVRKTKAHKGRGRRHDRLRTPYGHGQRGC